MRKPAVPRAMREAFASDLGRIRESDCQWPRLGGRPRCRRCFACDMATAEEMLSCGAPSMARH